MRELILVVTTDSSFLNQLQLWVGGEHNLREASTRKEAIDIAIAQHPALVIVDDNVPDVNGYDLCGILKTEFNLENMYFMLLVGDKSKIDAGRASLVDLDCFEAKPVKKEKLVKRIHELIAKGLEVKEKGGGPRVEHKPRPRSIAVDVDEEPDSDRLFVRNTTQFEEYHDTAKMKAQTNKVIDGLKNEEKFEGMIYHGIDNAGSGENADLDPEPNSDDIPLLIDDNYNMLEEVRKRAQNDTKGKDQSKYVDPVSQFLSSAESENMAEAPPPQAMPTLSTPEIGEISITQSQALVVKTKVEQIVYDLPPKVREGILEAVNKSLKSFVKE